MWLVVWGSIRYFAIPGLTNDNIAVVKHASFEVLAQSFFIFYLLGEFVFPQFLYQKKFTSLIFWILCLFQGIYIINYYEFSYLIKISGGPHAAKTLYVQRAWEEYFKPNSFISCFTNFKIAYLNYAWSFFYVTPLLAVKVMKDIISSRTRNLRLERDRLILERNNMDLQSQSLQLQRNNLILEVSYLKSQINPHFLFNILNAIYNKTFDADPQAADMVVKLANLMRYSLYESNKEMALLTEEIEYIQNYIELEKLRYSGTVDIEFKIQGELTPFIIAPLLLISFIENAFKHGIKLDDKLSFVHVDISMVDAELYFSVRNSFRLEEPIAIEKVNSMKTVGGVGLSNTKKRLEMLYPSGHNLSIDREASYYEVRLNIDLSRNVSASVV